MLRLLFWIVVIFAAIWLWRKFKAGTAADTRPTLDDPLKMVRCAHCGVHLPNDRAHRIKRHRPLASGAIGIPTAVGLGLVMLGLAFVLALAVSTGFAWMLLAYTVTTLAYSLVLKRLALIDVLVLSGLYTLRIGAGAVAAGVDLSNWLLAISIFLFLSLALVKRCAELEELDDHRSVLAPGRGYQPRDLASLRAMGMASGFLAVMVLSINILGDGLRDMLDPRLARQL